MSRVSLGVNTMVAPVRERGLKYNALSRKLDKTGVAPVRERGLKLTSCYMEIA